MKNSILFGDCRDTLPTIDVKARMCVTSPPYYGLRNYGGEENQIGQEDTPEQFIDNLVSVFRSCLLYTSPSPRDAHESRMPSSA